MVRGDLSKLARTTLGKYLLLSILGNLPLVLVGQNGI